MSVATKVNVFGHVSKEMLSPIANARDNIPSHFFARFGSLSSVIRFRLVILLHEKFLQFDWLRAVVFQLNLKYLHVKITNLLRVVV